ncbi:ImmA/IrrE family metallo-endopeptidase [Streptomyces kaniharaensis]|uniref:ImmA/IrrE family metallo-endopeptidase n=1 Tax=Streptomyces kaniharaensis TaxID=212423 RepID=A0A6N7L5X5_9ACTN|nr:ArdC-like ssDNA-binding domain-containing protein [Streptomyces kaniharaensis]MQS17473.1 ImmA/IrrE family metallo-endopeptidase [Streptomyces kaniharaensis]
MTTRTSSRRRSKPSKSTTGPATEQERMAEALHEQLTETVMELVNSEGWTAMLDKLRGLSTTSMFRYSFRNVMLILMQCPQASLVCGPREWEALGRSVAEGQQPLRIWAPSTSRRKDADAHADHQEPAEQEPATEEATADRAERPARRAPRFTLVRVFDVSQTVPVWQEGPLYTITPALSVRRFGADTPGEAPAEMRQDLEAYAAQLGYQVETGETGTSRGWVDPDSRTVMISDRVTNAQAAVTLAHELAGHVGCGHLESDPDEYRHHRGRMETEAESVAYMVAARYGVDSAVKSASYIGEWAGGSPKKVRKTLMETGEAVRKAFRAYVESVEGAEEPRTEVRELAAV